MLKILKELLINSVSELVEDNDCSLLLSGGVDSISVGLAAHHLGKTISAYSFCLDTYKSYDFVKAKEICSFMNWTFVPIVIPSKNIVEDFHKLVALGCKNKTHFECVYPFLYVYPKIRDKFVLTGWGADGYFGLSKKALINFKEPKELFDKFRNNYFLPNNTAGMKYHKWLAEKYNKVMINPYLDSRIKEFFFAKDWYDLNMPKQKHHIRDAFVEFNDIGNIKPHINLQKESKISLLFETLLDDKNINHKNRIQVKDMCNDWSAGGLGSLEQFM